MPLLGRLAPRFRADIALFARGGLAILRKIEVRGYNVWQARPALSKWEKLALLGGVVARKLKASLS